MKKMTRKRLETYKKLKWDIVCLEQELTEMIDTDKGLDSSVILDYRRGYPRPQSVVGFDWDGYEQKNDMLERKKQEAAEIKSWIDGIEDGQTRWVFKMWYMDGLPWRLIAKKMGIPHNEDYPRKCIRDSFLKKSGVA